VSRHDAPRHAAAHRRLLLAGLWLAILGTVLSPEVCSVARAQTPPPPKIVRPWDGYTARTTWPAGTSEIRCELAAIASAQIGAVQGAASPTEGEPVSLPLDMPPAEIRCRACNAAGCSDLSPNTLEIRQRSRADCNGDGTTNVSDMVCYALCIYRPETCPG